MSIETVHSYRFGYLKSDQWQNVRLEALAREKGKCQICCEESISNDAHHIWYPENIYETTERHLVILCRPCHEFIHEMLPDCKTRNEEDGMRQWVKFKNAIIAWRISHMRLFCSTEGLNLKPAKELRAELERLKAIITNGGISAMPVTKVSELRNAYDELKKRHAEQLRVINECIQTGQMGELLASGELRPPSIESRLDFICSQISSWAMSANGSAKILQRNLDRQDYMI